MKIADKIKAAAVLLNAHEISEIFGMLGFVSGRRPETSIPDHAAVKTTTEASLSFDNFKIVLHRSLEPDGPIPRLVFFVDEIEVDDLGFVDKLAAHSKEVISHSLKDNPDALAALEVAFEDLKKDFRKHDGGFPTGGESDFLPN